MGSRSSGTGPGGERPDEGALCALLRSGDEGAFGELVRQHHAALVRVAAMHVPSTAVAEEVAQETWLAVVQGIDRFEGRSSLRTWIFRILVNQAKTRGQRERRSTPVSSLAAELSGEAVPAERFFESGHRWVGHWSTPPDPWSDTVADRAVGGETQRVVADAIDALPPRQREVISLRDVEGWTAEEACELLSLSEGNQRVLLHRARTAVRSALERYYGAAA